MNIFKPEDFVYLNTGRALSLEDTVIYCNKVLNEFCGGTTVYAFENDEPWNLPKPNDSIKT